MRLALNHALLKAGQRADGYKLQLQQSVAVAVQSVPPSVVRFPRVDISFDYRIGHFFGLLWYRHNPYALTHLLKRSQSAWARSLTALVAMRSLPSRMFWW